MTDRRRRWPWLLVIAVLLLLVALLLYGQLAPAPGEGGKGAAFAPRDRVAILVAVEGGWGALLLAARELLRARAGMLGAVLRAARVAVTVAGLTVAALGGWLTWSFLASEVHGTSSGHHHHRDWD